MKSKVSAWTSRRLKTTVAAIATTVLALSFALPAFAQQEGAQQRGAQQGGVQQQAPRSQDVRLTLVVPEPLDQENPEIRRRQHQEMARLTKGRIEERLSRIGVKDFKVTVQPHGQLLIQVRGRWTRQQIASIVIPSGLMELRPVVQTGDVWMSIASGLPQGVELRQEETSFNADDAYLWSASYDTLARFSRRVSLGQNHVFVYPDAEGWRTVSLAASVANHRDIREVDMHTTPAGLPFVTLQFNQDTPARVRQNVVGEETTQLAVVIDDEIVAIVRYDAQRFTQRIELTCPPHLQTTEARRAWVQQVVGRLAVPMPITLAEL